MNGFIGREDELSKLDRLYRKHGSATCAVYGRRRVGKTSLLQQFCEGKPSLFMTVPGKDPDLTWDVLSAQASKHVGREVSLRSVPDLLGFLGEVGSAGNGDKTVVVLDEFPLLDEVDDSTAPLFQRFIDHDMKRFRLMLVVCGSSIRAMGRHLNDGDSPLYKRFILQMRIDPLPYPQACTFHRELSEEDRVRMFAVGSGIPAYHEYMEGMSVEQAITDGFLKEPALLRSEADSLVSLELKPKETYDRILASIREGVFDANDIEVRTGLTRPTCLAAIENLELLGVIREEVCYGKKRKRMFVVTDGFLDFYYDVALRSEPYGRFSRGEGVYGALGNRMAMFFGRRFEEVCRQYLLGTERCRWIGGPGERTRRHRGHGHRYRSRGGERPQRRSGAVRVQVHPPPGRHEGVREPGQPRAVGQEGVSEQALRAVLQGGVHGRAHRVHGGQPGDEDKARHDERHPQVVGGMHLRRFRRGMKGFWEIRGRKLRHQNLKGAYCAKIIERKLPVICISL